MGVFDQVIADIEAVGKDVEAALPLAGLSDFDPLVKAVMDLLTKVQALVAGAPNTSEQAQLAVADAAAQAAESAKFSSQ